MRPFFIQDGFADDADQADKADRQTGTGKNPYDPLNPYHLRICHIFATHLLLK